MDQAVFDNVCLELGHACVTAKWLASALAKLFELATPSPMPQHGLTYGGSPHHPATPITPEPASPSPAPDSPDPIDLLSGDPFAAVAGFISAVESTLPDTPTGFTLLSSDPANWKQAVQDVDHIHWEEAAIEELSSLLEDYSVFNPVDKSTLPPSGCWVRNLSSEGKGTRLARPRPSRPGWLHEASARGMGLT